MGSITSFVFVVATKMLFSTSYLVGYVATHEEGGWVKYVVWCDICIRINQFIHNRSQITRMNINSPFGGASKFDGPCVMVWGSQPLQSLPLRPPCYFQPPTLRCVTSSTLLTKTRTQNQSQHTCIAIIVVLYTLLKNEQCHTSLHFVFFHPNQNQCKGTLRT